ncbi:MAG: hypothetical protein RSD70_01210 [Acidaminococcaceae bacterium]
MGYAPANNPTMVVVAIVEQGGFGSVSAAPMVQRIFEYAFAAQPKNTKQPKQ